MKSYHNIQYCTTLRSLVPTDLIAGAFKRIIYLYYNRFFTGKASKKWLKTYWNTSGINHPSLIADGSIKNLNSVNLFHYSQID